MCNYQHWITGTIWSSPSSSTTWTTNCSLRVWRSRCTTTVGDERCERERPPGTRLWSRCSVRCTNCWGCCWANLTATAQPASSAWWATSPPRWSPPSSRWRTTTSPTWRTFPTVQEVAGGWRGCRASCQRRGGSTAGASWGEAAQHWLRRMRAISVVVLLTMINLTASMKNKYIQSDTQHQRCLSKYFIPFSDSRISLLAVLCTCLNTSIHKLYLWAAFISWINLNTQLNLWNPELSATIYDNHCLYFLNTNISFITSIKSHSKTTTQHLSLSLSLSRMLTSRELHKHMIDDRLYQCWLWQ